MSFHAQRVHLINPRREQWHVYQGDLLICSLPQNLLGAQQVAERIAVLLTDSRGIDLEDLRKGYLHRLFDAMWALTGRPLPSCVTKKEGEPSHVGTDATD